MYETSACWIQLPNLTFFFLLFATIQGANSWHAIKILTMLTYQLSLQSVTVHTFYMLKNKCRVIKNMLSYLFHVQRLIVFATMILHNFVRIHDKVDEEFNIYIH